MAGASGAQIVSVRSSAAQTPAGDTSQHSGQQRHAVPFVGAVVTCRVGATELIHTDHTQVIQTTPNFVKCHITNVENSRLSHVYNAQLRKEDIVRTGKDKVGRSAFYADVHFC